jgi:predicted RNA methylase
MTPMVLKRVALDPCTPFVFPPARELRVVPILRGRYAAQLADEELAGVPVRRVLDLGAGCGEFACWAFRRWPGCWVDLIEYDPDLAAIATVNAPPGAKVLLGGDLRIDVYDVVRIANVGRDVLSSIASMLSDVPILLIDLCEVLP